MRLHAKLGRTASALHAGAQPLHNRLQAGMQSTSKAPHPLADARSLRRVHALPARRRRQSAQLRRRHRSLQRQSTGDARMQALQLCHSLRILCQQRLQRRGCRSWRALAWPDAALSASVCCSVNFLKALHILGYTWAVSRPSIALSSTADPSGLKL